MLDAIEVFELGGGLAGSSSAAILAGLGARVTKLEPAECLPAFEPSTRRCSGTYASWLETLLDGRKGTIRRDLRKEDLPAELFAADLVLCDRVCGAGDFPGDIAEYLPWVEARNRGVWVTISAFGLTGPYAGYTGSELVSSAAGGLAATIAPLGGGRPSLLPGWQALLATGQVAALAALHGLELRRTRGRPVHMEVSAQESVAMVGALPECAHAIYACPGRAGSGRYVAPSGLFPCRDGQVRIIAPDNHQWAGMVRAMGEPGWTQGLETREARARHAERINKEIAAWTARRGIEQCAAELQAEGVPATPMNGPDELLASPQFEARGFIRPVRLGGIETRAPGPAYTWSPSGASTRPPAGREGIGGLRVAEFAHVFAGPIAGALLGAMGAHVVRFEDTARLDLYRRTGPFAGGIAGPERGAYFTVANHSKHSLAVDPGEQPGAAVALAAWSDVVLESFGTRRVARLAVNSDRMLSDRPELLYLSVSGFGQSGPLEAYRAYANNVHAYGGFSQLTRGTDGELVHIGTVLADPLAALTAATVIAAWALGSRRPGGVVDLSMAEVVASKLGEFIAEAAAGEERTVPVGCDRFPYAPHGIHPCSGGRWLAIAVQSDAEWDALLHAFGRPDALADPTWATTAARWEARRAIESALDNITREQEAETLFHRLQRAGVRASPVWTGGELIDNPHLLARDFFPRIDHPDPDIPNPRLIGLAWRVVGEGPLPLRPPPRLGEYRLAEETA